MGLPRLIALVLLAGCASETRVDARWSALRPDTRAGQLAPPTYPDDVTVEHHDSASFRVHYVTTGQHAVPGAEAARGVAEQYEEVLGFFRDTLGFMPPLSDRDLPDENGGDGRFDVYLLDFPTGADGSFRSEGCAGTPRRCTGYMLQENDFDGRSYPNLNTATRILASHELFHAVQAAYLDQPSIVLGEATAVWASETYDPTLDDFEGFIRGYLDRPERSLLQEPNGPPDGFSYGAGLFFVQLSEACSRNVVRALWQELKADESWALALDRVLVRDCSSTLAQAFARFARWNLFTGARASTEGYAMGARYPAVAESTLSLPFADDLLRMLPLAARYYVMDDSAEGISAWAGATPAATGIRWFAARERDGALAELREGEQMFSARAPGEAASGRVHVVLIDTRGAGATQRLSVCIGSPAHVADCVRRYQPASDAGIDERDAQAGEADASTTPVVAGALDAGSSAVDAEVRPTRDDSGCSLGGGAQGSSLALLLWLLGRRRSRLN